jgi:hypothetical protein
MKVEILKDKMKVLFCIHLLLISFSGKIVAQDINSIKKIISKEVVLLNMLYNDRMFINYSQGIDTANVKINHCLDLSEYYRQENFDYCKILIVNVSFMNLTPTNYIASNIGSLKFDYIMIEYQGIYYKLLGFSMTDINLLKKHHFNPKNFKKFIKWISTTLNKNKILTKYESRKFQNSIIKNDYYLSHKINRPINIINKIYPLRLYQTSIIDYNWIKPLMSFSNIN